VTFTLIELIIVVAILAALVLLASLRLGRWQDAEAVKSAARTVEGVFSFARSEAIRTGNNHIVFFLADIGGAALNDLDGDPVPILILDDGLPGSADQNCVIDAGEPIQTVSLENRVGFGVTSSTAKVGIDEGGTAFGGASTFADTGGGAATWVLFRSDGTPRAVDGACAQGALGSGGGGIYLSNAERDVAIVLTPLGASRVFAWNGSNSTWN
jgi:prepilin-type N-terminal cleavage/methylation domain-containing protein